MITRPNSGNTKKTAEKGRFSAKNAPSAPSLAEYQNNRETLKSLLFQLDTVVNSSNLSLQGEQIKSLLSQIAAIKLPKDVKMAELKKYSSKTQDMVTAKLENESRVDGISRSVNVGVREMMNAQFIADMQALSISIDDLRNCTPATIDYFKTSSALHNDMENSFKNFMDQAYSEESKRQMEEAGDRYRKGISDNFDKWYKGIQDRLPLESEEERKQTLADVETVKKELETRKRKEEEEHEKALQERDKHSVGSDEWKKWNVKAEQHSETAKLYTHQLRDVREIHNEIREVSENKNQRNESTYQPKSEYTENCVNEGRNDHLLDEPVKGNIYAISSIIPSNKVGYVIGHDSGTIKEIRSSTLKRRNVELAGLAAEYDNLASTKGTPTVNLASNEKHASDVLSSVSEKNKPLPVTEGDLVLSHNLSGAGKFSANDPIVSAPHATTASEPIIPNTSLMDGKNLSLSKSSGLGSALAQISDGTVNADANTDAVSIGIATRFSQKATVNC